MISLATHDQLLPVSWHSRAGDFISLMTLYESNYLRLNQLVPDLKSLHGSYASVVTDDCPLMLTVLERAPYTTTFSLTYVFDTVAGRIADPDLQVRVYHDAGMAEVLSCARWHRHEVLASIKSELYINLGERWLRNIMLNKWLDYCLTRGYQLAWRSER
ncbi:MAG: DUF1249 domain-containing protein [Steroidobacteraceae bacterium]